MTDYFESEIPFTTTTLLLLPAIGTSKRTLLKYGFINGFLTDSSHEVDYPEAVYLLFRPESWDKFNLYLERELLSENFITTYDYAGGYIVLVYSILPKYIKDYHLFMEGKYSKMSREYKDQFPKLVRGIDKISGTEVLKVSLPYHIFDKSPSMKDFWERDLGIKYTELGDDAEVWYKIDMKRETLDIDAIRMTVKV